MVELTKKLHKKEQEFAELEAFFIKYREEVRDESDAKKAVCEKCQNLEKNSKTQKREIERLEILVQTLQEIEEESNNGKIILCSTFFKIRSTRVDIDV